MAETITDTLTRLTAFIEQSFTDIETGPGSVISELLLKLAAQIHNSQYNAITALSQGASIKAIIESTDTATYSPLIDYIASNYNTTRSLGVKVTGKLKVYVSQDVGYTFRSGLTFTQPALGLNYVLTSDVRISSEPAAVLEELQLYTDNGLYYFILPVVAEKEGPEYQLSSGTTFDVASESFVTNFVKAEAYGNFASGKSPETDKELVANIRHKLGNSRLTTSTGIANRFSEVFPGFQTLSICGANDDEMVRSKRNVLGISTFGKADVYVRTSLGPETIEIVKTATKIAKDTWRVTLNNTDIPGFYEIKSIIPVTSTPNLGGTLILASAVDYSTTFYSGMRNNEISVASDSRFTKYQTAVATFTYTEIPTVAVNGTTQFKISASYQPNILEMQNLLLQDDERLACADYLVKAAVPCMVSLNLNLVKRRATDTYTSLNLQNLKKDIFTYINSIPFGGELHASNIVDICHNYDIKRVDLPVTMTGQILCPDNGAPITLTDTDVLTIPTNVARGVTPKTTLYFIDYYKIVDGVATPQDNIGLNIA
jgi:hypothetical protein